MLVICPTDGKVVVIEKKCLIQSTLARKDYRYLFFMSPANVHVNPVGGVQCIIIRKYLVAWNLNHLHENERHSIVIPAIAPAIS